MVAARSRMKAAESRLHSSGRSGGESRVLLRPTAGVLQNIATATGRMLVVLQARLGRRLFWPAACGCVAAIRRPPGCRYEGHANVFARRRHTTPAGRDSASAMSAITALTDLCL